MGCTHERRRFGRVILRDGRQHLMQQCLDCGENARGEGRWVKAEEIPDPIHTLPVLRDHRSAESRGEQPSLFDQFEHGERG